MPGGWARLCEIFGNMAGGVFCCPAGLAALSVCLQISVQISFANCLAAEADSIDRGTDLISCNVVIFFDSVIVR